MHTPSGIISPLTQFTDDPLSTKARKRMPFRKTPSTNAEWGVVPVSCPRTLIMLTGFFPFFFLFLFVEMVLATGGAAPWMDASCRSMATAAAAISWYWVCSPAIRILS